MKSLLRKPRVQILLAALLGGYLRFALGTTRWTLDGQQHYERFAGGAPALCAFWHECLPCIPAIIQVGRRVPAYRPARLYTLVSKHRDGRFIGEIVRRFGIVPILGSSSRGGAAALRTLLTVLKDGGQIGITPDGPRGPRRQAAPGVAQLAAMGGVPVIPCAARTRFAIGLNSWDRMRVPLPFGRGVMVFGPVIDVPRQNWKDAVPIIAEALNRVADRAERLV